jgi:hypothetical protein
MEIVCQRGAGTELYRQRWSNLVSSCSSCRSGNCEVVPGSFTFFYVIGPRLTMWHNKIRLYSRDMELTSQNILHHEMLAAPVIILSIVDNSLLVYMADNTLQHYLIVPTADSIKLHLCRSITFTGIIAAPNAVRMLSWMIPGVQKRRKLHSLLRLLFDMLYRIGRSSR